MSGEGCFYIQIADSSSVLSGFQVRLKFKVTQHSRDTELIKSIIKYLDCGIIATDPRGPAVEIVVSKLKDITEKIIPFFDKSPIIGVKSLDYADFKRAAEIIKAKEHLTADGLEEIRKIKAGMNTGRDNGSC